MNKEAKQKSKQVWYTRLLVASFYVPIALGSFADKTAQDIYNQLLQLDETVIWISSADRTKPGDKVKIYQESKKFPKLQDATDEAQLFIVVKTKQEQDQELQNQLTILGISALCILLILITMLKQGNRISLTLASQLTLILPEECIAELGALHHQMKSEKHSILFIKMVMLWSLLELLWAFHVQIKVENLWLSKSKVKINKQNRIDDQLNKFTITIINHINKRD